MRLEAGSVHPDTGPDGSCQQSRCQFPFALFRRLEVGKKEEEEAGGQRGRVGRAMVPRREPRAQEAGIP